MTSATTPARAGASVRCLTPTGPRGGGCVTLGAEPLGSGGEGAVFPVVSHQMSGLPDADLLVAKMYHNPEAECRREKIITMVSHPPDSTQVAWPLGMIVDGHGQFAGYLMRRLDPDTFQQWLVLSNARDRKRTAPTFDVRYAVVACRNLASTLGEVHRAGAVIGDVNESNIFVSATATVFVVDTDSAQIRAADGTLFPCTVGKPEFTAPELTHGALRDLVRTPATDVFAFAVAAFQMLSGGAHPADGIYTKPGDPPSVTEKIRSGTFPALSGKTPGFRSAERIPTDAIPSRLRHILSACVQVDATRRPTVGQVTDVFDDVVAHLTRCRHTAPHWFDRRDGHCGWCTHAQAGHPDPWSDTTGRQTVTHTSRRTPHRPRTVARRPSGAGSAAALWLLANGVWVGTAILLGAALIFYLTRTGVL